MDLTGLVQSVPTGVFVFVEIFLVACVGILAAAGVHARRRAALVEKTETSPIEFAEDGYRELEGTIEAAGAAAEAPLTGWSCVWYRFTVEKFVGSRVEGGTSRWERVDGGTSDRPFVVRDATGACLVRPAGAEITPTDFSVWYGATRVPKDRNPERKPPTESRTPAVEFAGGSHKYRYTEERIYAGDPLLVLGHFASGRFQGRPDAATGEGDEDLPAGIRSAIGKGGGQPFIITTTPQAAHLAMSQVGSEAALYMAGGFAAIAALLAWVRAS